VGNCHKAALSQKEDELSVVLCYPPTPTLDLPDLTSGVWAAPLQRVSLRFTSIEAFDDLNLRFGSRPSLAAALSPLTLSISSQPILPVGTINLRRQNKVSAFLGQMSPYATSPSTFFLIGRTSFVTPAARLSLSILSARRT
jgi:hypothetical protein